MWLSESQYFLIVILKSEIFCSSVKWFVTPIQLKMYYSEDLILNYSNTTLKYWEILHFKLDLQYAIVKGVVRFILNSSNICLLTEACL